MQLDAAQIDDPGKSGRIIHHELFGGPSGRKRQSDRMQPSGPVGGCAFLVKGLSFSAVYEALENQRAITDAAQRTLRYRQVIAYEIKFRELRLFRKIWLVRVRNADLPALNRQQFRGIFLAH